MKCKRGTGVEPKFFVKVLHLCHSGRERENCGGTKERVWSRRIPTPLDSAGVPTYRCAHEQEPQLLLLRHLYLPPLRWEPVPVVCILALRPQQTGSGNRPRRRARRGFS